MIYKYFHQQCLELLLSFHTIVLAWYENIYKFKVIHNSDLSTFQYHFAYMNCAFVQSSFLIISYFFIVVNQSQRVVFWSVRTKKREDNTGQSESKIILIVFLVISGMVHCFNCVLACKPFCTDLSWTQSSWTIYTKPSLDIFRVSNDNINHIFMTSKNIYWNVFHS